MKKIGIITFHKSHNCGSILQAYAMQEAVRQSNYEPEIINFSSEGQQELYSVIRPLDGSGARALIRSLYFNAIGISLYKRLSANSTSYNNFINAHIHESRELQKENLDERSLSYDLYLTGSDQVWNVTIVDYDEAYFLNFVQEHPKIAYAVSQGAKDINKYAKKPTEIAKYIKNIDFVSTREENGQKWLKALTKNEYPVVLDPTLLHKQDIYTKIEAPHGIRDIRDGEYIFIYATPLSRAFLKKIKKYAKANNLKLVIWHTDTWLRSLGWLSGIKCPEDQNPGKYLDLIKNAKFICTSSFHGVAFSTIYRKDFVVLENDGMRAGDDDRMTGFLRRLKLSDRIVNLDQFNKKMNETINYTNFEVELGKSQKLSREFLENALNKSLEKNNP